MVTAVGVGVGDSRGRGRSGLVDTVRCQRASAEPAWSRRWAVEMRVFTHAHVSIITY